MWVVKLGGSLSCSRLLPAWLETLSRPGGPERVIVPGGGPFAGQVRRVQERCAFPDATAHRMAILAMEQYGLMLCALAPRFRPAATLEEIRGILRSGDVPVWMAARMTTGRDDIPARWAVTSDSLAAWLAGQAGGQVLLLVKSGPVPEDAAGSGVPVATLCDSGLVDEAFGTFISGRPFEVRCIGACRHADMAAALDGGPPPGVRVDADG